MSFIGLNHMWKKWFSKNVVSKHCSASQSCPNNSNDVHVQEIMFGMTLLGPFSPNSSYFKFKHFCWQIHSLYILLVLWMGYAKNSTNQPTNQDIIYECTMFELLEKNVYLKYKLFGLYRNYKHPWWGIIFRNSSWVHSFITCKIIGSDWDNWTVSF